jgi:hypothetical protein
VCVCSPARTPPPTKAAKKFFADEEESPTIKVDMDDLDASPTGAKDPLLSSAAAGSDDDGFGLPRRLSPRKLKRRPITITMPWPERQPLAKTVRVAPK